MKNLRVVSMIVVIVLAGFVILAALMNLVRSLGTMAEDTTVGFGAVVGSLLLLGLAVYAITWAVRSIGKIRAGKDGPDAK